MGFADKKLPAPGPSPLSLARSSEAEPIGELRAMVTVETREDGPRRRHGKQACCLRVRLTPQKHTVQAQCCSETNNLA